MAGRPEEARRQGLDWKVPTGSGGRKGGILECLEEDFLLLEELNG